MSEKQSEEKQEIQLNNDDCVAENEKENQFNNEEHVKQVVAEVIRSEFSGPIPPPSIIRGYEEILPGSADRIMKMAENQSIHRQSMERKMIETESRDSFLGIVFAFILGIGCILAAIIIVVTVPQNAGAISGALIGVTGIGSIIATFIKSTRSNYGNNKNNSDNENKK